MQGSRNRTAHASGNHETLDRTSSDLGELANITRGWMPRDPRGFGEGTKMSLDIPFYKTFPQPRRLRSTFSYGIRILGARPYCSPLPLHREARPKIGTRPTFWNTHPEPPRQLRQTALPAVVGFQQLPPQIVGIRLRHTGWFADFSPLTLYMNRRNALAYKIPGMVPPG